MNELQLNKFEFDGAGCYRAICLTIDAYINQLSDQMIMLFKKEIAENSNTPSKIMKSDAKAAVREISKKLENGLYTLEVGVDENYARSVSKEFYTRTMVTLYGNLETGAGKLYTKPRQYTWRKHVRDYHMNTFSKKVKRLKPLEQRSHVTGIIGNVMKASTKYVNDFIDGLIDHFNDDFFEQFVTTR